MKHKSVTGNQSEQALGREIPAEALEHFSHDDIFRMMVLNSPLPVSIQNEQWQFVFVNDAYCKFVGYEFHELIGRDPSDFLFPPEEDPQLMAIRQQLDISKALLLPEYPAVRELVRKDGKRARFHGDISQTRTRNGERLRSGVIFDLTHVEQTRASLLQARQLSNEMNFRFDSFAALSNEAMIVADVSGDQILHANSVVWDVLGLEAPNLAQTPIATLWQNIVKSDQPKFADAMHSGASQRGNEINVMLDHPNGSQRSLRIRTFRSGSPTAETYILAEDMSEHVRHEEQRLHDALMRRETLVKEVHHRIKNNLQGVIGVLQVARINGASAENAIDQAIHKINAIAEVNGMLTSGSSQVAIKDLVPRLAEYLGNAFNVQVTTRFILENEGAAPLRIDGDSVPVALVMNEIITNAIKHHEGNTPIQVELRQSAKVMTISVRNSGQINQPGLFESAQPATYGLGLVKALLPEAHRQFSLVQEGSTVVARLTLDTDV